MAADQPKLSGVQPPRVLFHGVGGPAGYQKKYAESVAPMEIQGCGQLVGKISEMKVIFVRFQQNLPLFLGHRSITQQDLLCFKQENPRLFLAISII